MMKADIMNEILTITVSKLFTKGFDAHSMPSKGKEESKADHSATSESKMIAEMKTIYQKESLGGMDLERWITIEGPKRLEESMKKLKLNKESVKRKDFTTYIEEELVQEKKNVKNELKNYDNAFISIFGRAPARQDKEPMRPLYMYYQNLRKAITKKAYAKGAPTGAKGAKADARSGSVGANDSGVNSSKLSMGSIGGGSEQGKADTKSKGLLFSEEEKSSQSDSVSKMPVIENERDLKKQIHDFMKERKNLRKVLDNFQKEFLKTYNRKLRFTKDIAPVATEFKRYKELKREIAKLEGMLGSIKKAEKK